MRKKLFTLLLALGVSAGIAQAAVYNGTCGAEEDGNNIEWSYNTETNGLIITGEGTMADYSSDYNQSPWYTYRTSIRYISFQGNISTIGNYAFCYCTKITSVTIPNTVTSIGDGAFQGCTKLTHIEIPNSVTTFGISIFSGCNSMTNPIFNAHVFVHMPISYAGAYTIPSGIEQMVYGTFENCTDLTSIEIPNSVTSIGLAAFESCSMLSSVTIPNSVISLEERVFQKETD